MEKFSPSSPRCPLGRSASHDHFIAPVRPFFVSEYEDAFRWPPKQFYQQWRPRSAIIPVSKTLSLWNTLSMHVSEIRKITHQYDEWLTPLEDVLRSRKFADVMETSIPSFRKVLEKPVGDVQIDKEKLKSHAQQYLKRIQQLKDM